MAISNERKKQRILHHASSVASTMKNGQRKFIPRQKVNGGKVMIEKASGDKFKVYMASDKRFQGILKFFPEAEAGVLQYEAYKQKKGDK